MFTNMVTIICVWRMLLLWLWKSQQFISVHIYIYISVHIYTSVSIYIRQCPNIYTRVPIYSTSVATKHQLKINSCIYIWKMASNNSWMFLQFLPILVIINTIKVSLYLVLLITPKTRKKIVKKNDVTNEENLLWWLRKTSLIGGGYLEPDC